MRVDIRKPTDDDLTRFKECLALDNDHSKQDAAEWMATPGEFWTFYDEAGNRVWARLDRCLRVSIQHDPASPRKALAPLIYKGMFWIQGAARNKGFSEILFESRAPRLIQFVQKLFGFEPVKENYHLCVDRQAPKRV